MGEAIANIEPVVMRHIVAELKIRGIDPVRVLHGLGITEAQLQGDLKVSYTQTSQCIRRAARLLGEPSLGLRLGKEANPVSWGPFFVGLMACADSREMLEFAIEFLPSTGRLLRLSIEAGPDGPAVAARPITDDPLVNAFLVEQTFASLVRAFRRVAGPAFRATGAQLTMPPPTTPSLYAEALGCEVSFAKPIDRLQFTPQIVGIESADARMARMIRLHLRGDPKERFATRSTEMVILNAIGGRLRDPPTLAEIAFSMHLSERTLRRRLSEQNLSFAALLDRERRERAVALIRGKQSTLAEIALQVGFVDARSLRRAVRRWTGRSSTSLRHGDTWCAPTGSSIGPDSG